MSGRERIAALRRSHDALATEVHRLEGGTLNKQSGAAEWTVADVLGHMGSASEIGVATVTTGAVDRDSMPSIWDRWNAMSPAEKAANFVVADARFVETVEGLNDEALANRTIDVGFLPAPIDITMLLGMRLSEHALHSWDVFVAFNPSAVLAHYAVPILLEDIVMMAGFFATAIGKSARVAIETTEPAHSYLLQLHEDKAVLTEGAAADVDGRVSMPAEAFLRLTAGRLKPDHTPSSVTIDGAVSLDELRKVFPGY